ncbi:hypothetical protein BDV96DRAFT_653914 [Lophiotrema nucula]|uniref:C2H2-type domain-containing protein n=1 Tax=Lophiotrema nucula TaxID=690887 RepID=A0A6A5YK23_9PLEO|nr:hypothetical protein BDV96DRAFT_653914 [Lophiotrema nucula]
MTLAAGSLGDGETEGHDGVGTQSLDSPTRHHGRDLTREEEAIQWAAKEERRFERIKASKKQPREKGWPEEFISWTEAPAPRDPKAERIYGFMRRHNEHTIKGPSRSLAGDANIKPQRRSAGPPLTEDEVDELEREKSRVEGIMKDIIANGTWGTGWSGGERDVFVRRNSQIRNNRNTENILGGEQPELSTNELSRVSKVTHAESWLAEDDPPEDVNPIRTRPLKDIDDKFNSEEGMGVLIDKVDALSITHDTGPQYGRPRATSVRQHSKPLSPRDTLQLSNFDYEGSGNDSTTDRSHVASKRTPELPQFTNDRFTYPMHNATSESGMTIQVSPEQAFQDQLDNDVPAFAHSARHSILRHVDESPETPQAAAGAGSGHEHNPQLQSYRDATSSIVQRPTGGAVFPRGNSLQNSQQQQSPPIGPSAQPSSQEGGSKQPRAKKRERGDGRDPGDGDGDDSTTDDDDRRRNKRGKMPAHRKPHLGLRCPFYLRQPDKYRNVQACSNEGGFADFSRLRFHLKRAHTQPLQCPRCWEEMKTREDCNVHLRQTRPCEIQPKPESDQLTLEEWEATEKIVRAPGSVEKKWSRLFRKLFPTDEKVPPCFDKSVFVSQIDDILAGVINAVLRTEFPDMERPGLERVKHQIVQRCKNRLLQPEKQLDDDLLAARSADGASIPERVENSHRPRPSPILAQPDRPSLSLMLSERMPSNEFFWEDSDTVPNNIRQTTAATEADTRVERAFEQSARGLQERSSLRISHDTDRGVRSNTDSSHTTQLSNSLILPASERTSMTSYAAHPNHNPQPLSEIAESSNSHTDLLELQDQHYATKYTTDALDPQSETWMLFNWDQNDTFDFTTGSMPGLPAHQRHGQVWGDLGF